MSLFSRMTIILLITITLLLIGCMPTTNGEELTFGNFEDTLEKQVVNEESAKAPVQEDEFQSESASIQNPNIQNADSDLVEPSPTIDPTTQKPGQVESNTGIHDEQTNIESSQNAPALTSWNTYTDTTYNFSISVPPDFVVDQLSQTDLVAHTPTPLAATEFVDSDTMQSDVADLAPPNLLIRVFANETQEPIEEWLTNRGLLDHEAGWYTEPFEGLYTSGISVYSPSFMAPGWFVYVTDQSYVYQLTALGTDAELMLNTFSVSNSTSAIDNNG